MEKKEQLLQIEPQNELKFVGPFNHNITSFMRLTNPTDKTICFKIKTTAPKKYCVRPNSGTLTSKRSLEVAISLQPFTFDPNEKNKHKFMVQSLIAPDDAEFSFEQMWKDASPDQLMDSKLRCVFELPDENSVKPATTDSSELTVVSTTVSTNNATSEVQQIGSAEKVTIRDLTSPELASTTAEINQLRQDKTQLRQENLALKEQLLRLRMLNNESSNNESTTSVFDNPYQPVKQEPQLPMIYILIAVAMIVFGIIMGKFIL